MKRQKQILIAMMLATGIAANAQESGNGAGNGGGGIACYAADGRTLTSFTILDLVEGSGYGLPFENEASYRYSIPETRDQKLPLEVREKYAQVEIARALAKISAFPRVRSWIEKQVEIVRAGVKLIDAQNKLETTADFGKLHYEMLPRNCSIYQMARYNTGFGGTHVKVKVDTLAYGLMDSKNIASFYLHEAVYRVLRELTNDRTSERSRNLTAILISNDDLVGFKYLLEDLEKLPNPPFANSKEQIEFERVILQKLVGCHYKSEKLLHPYSDVQGEMASLRFSTVNEGKYSDGDMITTSLVHSDQKNLSWLYLKDACWGGWKMRWFPESGLVKQMEYSEEDARIEFLDLEAKTMNIYVRKNGGDEKFIGKFTQQECKK